MTDIVAPPTINALPPGPRPTDTPAEFDAKGFATIQAQEAMVPQINAAASATHQNAVAANERAVSAAASADTASNAANTASTKRDEAVTAAATATTKAAEADASATAASKLNLGDKSSPPTTDNQGGALRAGATYYDTTLQQWRVWTGSGWGAGLSINLSNEIHSATEKPTPVDSDELGIIDSAAGFSLKKLTFAALKTWLASLFVSKTGATMTGGLTVPSLNGGQLAGHRNKIINGAFQVNQDEYVSGVATSAGQYTFDMWKVTGTQGLTFSTSEGKTTVTIPAGQTLQQVIEGLNLRSGTYVLSWSGTAQGRIGAGAYGASGVVTAALTGGANATIEFSAGTVADVQFELGSVATPFEQRAHGAELALCQRYYEEGYFELRCYSQYGTSNRVNFKVTKRAAPTLTISGIDFAGTGAIDANADSPDIDSFRAGANWTSTPAWRSVGFYWKASARL